MVGLKWDGHAGEAGSTSASGILTLKGEGQKKARVPCVCAPLPARYEITSNGAHCPCVRVFKYIPIVSQGGEAPSQDSNTIHFPETSGFIDCQIFGLHPKSYPVTRFSRPAVLSPNIG